MPYVEIVSMWGRNGIHMYENLLDNSEQSIKARARQMYSHIHIVPNKKDVETLSCKQKQKRGQIIK